MRGAIGSLLNLLTTPAGVIILAALDSTMFLFLPLGVDAVVIVLAARSHTFAWTVPLLATGGSVAGAAFTFWMGATVGEKGLERYISPRSLERMQRRARDAGAITLAVADLIPPPFPFTALVLTAGALKVSYYKFFATLTACRLLRFGLEAVLASIYGTVLLSWFESERFHDIVLVLVVLAIAASIFSLVKLLKSSRVRTRRRAAA
jgi:membrane protein YqaA with SNARE-associated domain